MKMYIKDGNEGSRKQTISLTSENILKYLITEDDKINTLITCKGSEFNFITTDHAVYEALGSIKAYDPFKLNKLTKFFEVVKVVSFVNVFKKDKPILKEKRVEELRNKTIKLQNSDGGEKNDN
ncbi:hypothetical protein CMO89_03515 [Candidatus Woesearchaeota archaeon]|nr:hypothetical protein [Candidatus Woesearchaeota archaeon]